MNLESGLGQDDKMSKRIMCLNCRTILEVDVLSVPVLNNADYTAKCCDDPDYVFYDD